MSAVDFVIRAAREFRRGGWVFTGFHWPVLAGQLAHRLDGERFVQVFEAGAGTWEAGRLVPTSTTDYPAYANGLGYTAASPDVLLAMARRFDRVLLDASNIDLLGRVNSSFIGNRAKPTVRLPGGGGAPDIAARARELVWLHGGRDLRRIQSRVDHVTAAPGPGALVRMHTRWGIVRLGADPAVEELAPDVPGVEEFLHHLEQLGVRTDGPSSRPPSTEQERAAAIDLFTQAAERGYSVAVAALEEARSQAEAAR